jgi:three-Cys-motif partner protein
LGAKREPRRWGFWTQAKLEVLAEYLDRFTTASKSVSERIYLDAFAGEGTGVDRLSGHEFRGSPLIALDIDDPPFSRLRFFELPGRAQALEARLRELYPGRDIRVLAGDCNVLLPKALDELSPLRWAPTFAFLDPDGMDLQWESIKSIAEFRSGRHKAEMWILFPSGGLLRTLMLDQDRPTSEADTARATQMFGTRDWQRTFEARRRSLLTGREAREGYVNLMRWQLHQDLGYKWVHPLRIQNVRGAVIYHMLFATDHDAGTRIMSSLYDRAIEELPARQQSERDEKSGRPRLFDPTPYGSPNRYEYINPVAPDEFLSWYRV